VTLQEPVYGSAFCVTAREKIFTVFAAAAVVGARDNFGISDQTAVVLRVETAVRRVIEHARCSTDFIDFIDFFVLHRLVR
jgi:hypothetical protein